MKKIGCLFVLVVLLVSCGTSRSLDLNRLTTGMTKADVERVAGFPDRILAVNETSDGYQEVLKYRTTRGEIYALEFWNDYLTGYEYMYEDVQYVPAPYPPTIFPPYGRPLYVYPGGTYRPNYNRPGYNRPNYQTRPPATRPGNDNSNTTVRPSRPDRESGSNNSNSSSGTQVNPADRTNRTSRSNRTN
ncbi:MAG: hypothetical protein LIP01_11145 [Tannerellaceae bacterium]|nr:hypothetical protein [Tannerellaceae bacterium]